MGKFGGQAYFNAPIETKGMVITPDVPLFSGGSSSSNSGSSGSGSDGGLEFSEDGLVGENLAHNANVLHHKNKRRALKNKMTQDYINSNGNVSYSDYSNEIMSLQQEELMIVANASTMKERQSAGEKTIAKAHEDPNAYLDDGSGNILTVGLYRERYDPNFAPNADGNVPLRNKDLDNIMINNPKVNDDILNYRGVDYGAFEDKITQMFKSLPTSSFGTAEKAKLLTDVLNGVDVTDKDGEYGAVISGSDNAGQLMAQLEDFKSQIQDVPEMARAYNYGLNRFKMGASKSLKGKTDAQVQSAFMHRLTADKMAASRNRNESVTTPQVDKDEMMRRSSVIDVMSGSLGRERTFNLGSITKEKIEGQTLKNIRSDLGVLVHSEKYKDLESYNSFNDAGKALIEELKKKEKEINNSSDSDSEKIKKKNKLKTEASLLIAQTGMADGYNEAIAWDQLKGKDSKDFNNAGMGIASLMQDVNTVIYTSLSEGWVNENMPTKENGKHIFAGGQYKIAGQDFSTLPSYIRDSFDARIAHTRGMINNVASKTINSNTDAYTYEKGLDMSITLPPHVAKQFYEEFNVTFWTIEDGEPKQITTTLKGAFDDYELDISGLGNEFDRKSGEMISSSKGDVSTDWKTRSVAERGVTLNLVQLYDMNSVAQDGAEAIVSAVKKNAEKPNGPTANIVNEIGVADPEN